MKKLVYILIFSFFTTLHAQEIKLGISVDVFKKQIKKLGCVKDSVFMTGTIKPRINYISADSVIMFETRGRINGTFDDRGKLRDVMWSIDSMTRKDFDYISKKFASELHQKFGGSGEGDLTKTDKGDLTRMWFILEKYPSVDFAAVTYYIDRSIIVSYSISEK